MMKTLCTSQKVIRAWLIVCFGLMWVGSDAHLQHIVTNSHINKEPIFQSAIYLPTNYYSTSQKSIYIFVCVLVCGCAHACVHVCARVSCACACFVCVRMSVCVFARDVVHACECMCACQWVRAYGCAYVCTCVGACVWMCVCTLLLLKVALHWSSKCVGVYGV